MDCDAFDASDNAAEIQAFMRPKRISSTMHADILAQVLHDPFPLSSAMNAQNAQGETLGFIYRVRLMKEIMSEYGILPTRQECAAFMHHPVFIAAISEIEPQKTLKSMLKMLDSTYFDRFILKDRCRNFV